MSGSIFNKILTFIRYLLRGGKTASVEYTGEPPHTQEVKGFHGKFQGDCMMLREDGQVVLNIDFYFPDTPSWLEWDVGTGKLAIAQMGGAMAELNIELPASQAWYFETVKRVLLITRRDEGEASQNKLVHFISLIVRQ